MPPPPPVIVAVVVIGMSVVMVVVVVFKDDPKDVHNCLNLDGRTACTLISALVESVPIPDNVLRTSSTKIQTHAHTKKT